MTKILCGVCILFLSLLASEVYCQRERNESSGKESNVTISSEGGGLWRGLRDLARGFVEDMALDVWNDFTGELRAMYQDARKWTQDAFDRVRQTMKTWVSNRDDISSKDKKEMNTYINRLKMPTEATRRV